MNTSWSTPKRNIISGMLDLRRALASGYNARLVKARNEDCSHPIRVKKHDNDFRNYEFSIGYQSTREQIETEGHRTDFEIYLTLNYKACYGTPEAMDRYYETGELCADNFKSMGRCHLVKISDMIEYLEKTGDNERAEMFRKYLEDKDVPHFYDFFKHKHDSAWSVKKFRKKLWVVELLEGNRSNASVPVLVHILNVLLYPLKFVPERRVLKLDYYKLVTYRIGDVTNGFSIEFHIPKKFSFK